MCSRKTREERTDDFFSSKIGCCSDEYTISCDNKLMLITIFTVTRKMLKNDTKTYSLIFNVNMKIAVCLSKKNHKVDIYRTSNAKSISSICITVSIVNIFCKMF